MGETGKRPQVTRDVDPSALGDLLESAPRASVAFATGDAVDLLPARARFADGTWAFGVIAAEAPELEGREVVAVVDDGPFWFELRGVSVRGVARRGEPPRGGGTELVWYVVEATRVLAWHYGSMRRVG